VRNEPSDQYVEKNGQGKNGKLGKKSQLALAAKKCRPIRNYLVRKISATSVKYPPTTTTTAPPTDYTNDGPATKPSPTVEPTKEEATIKMEDKDYATKKRPSRVTKKKVSYCEDSELEFDEDSYEQSKTKSFKKMVKATNSDSDSVEFELGPEADTSDRDEEADTVHSEIESENVDPIAVVFDEKDEVATKPSTDAKSSAVSKSLTDKEKRATNKKMKKEVLQNIPQFKAVLSVPFAFGPEHWKVLLSQMENGGDYTNQLFFGQSRVSQDWRAQTLVKARAKLGIGIIQVREGGRALGGSSDMRECVNPGEHCDGDHCFHRLMLISNSIYFCFPMDHTTNQCLSVSRKKARDWNYTLAQREYVCGN
jgi:hypothetical protein